MLEINLALVPGTVIIKYDGFNVKTKNKVVWEFIYDISLIVLSYLIRIRIISNFVLSLLIYERKR